MRTSTLPLGTIFSLEIWLSDTQREYQPLGYPNSFVIGPMKPFKTSLYWVVTPFVVSFRLFGVVTIRSTSTTQDDASRHVVNGNGLSTTTKANNQELIYILHQVEGV